MATLQTLPEAATLLPLVESAGSTTSMAARSFFYAVFKHSRLVIGVFLLVWLCSAIVAIIRPRTYRASTKVIVKIGETTQLAPAEAPSRSMFQPLTPEVVNTEAEIVKSRQVLSEAVDRLGVKPEEGTSRDQMLDAMGLALTVSPTPSSNVLQISYIGRYPEKVRRFVDTLTDVYLEYHNRAYRNDQGVHSFYSDQLRLLESKMKAAQHALARYLRRNNVVEADQEVRILNQDVLDQEKTVQSHHAKISGVEQKLAQLRQQLARTPRKIAFQEEYQQNPSMMQLRAKVTDLEMDRTRLLESYLPSDRHIQDLDEQIQSIRSQIRREEERILNKETLQENEAYRDIERNANTHEVALADLRAREPGLVQRLGETQKHLHALRDQRFVINNLKQDADQKAYAFDLYYRKREEARIAESMKNQNLVSVSVVERASVPQEPLSGLILPLLLGLVGGIGLAAALAVAVEFVNRRLRFEEEVERYLELPVLAVIPDLENRPAAVKA